MLSAEGVIADYESALDEVGEIIEISRHLGTNLTSVFRCSVRARVKNYVADGLVGGIIQGRVEAIVLFKDLIAANFGMPVQGNRMIVRGKEYTVEPVDSNTGRIGTTQVFVKLTAKG